jgi:tRNA dimethylallyltransferase
MKKALVICGPTATGKTSLGLKLAKKYNGQIISADSRQVYKGMDIGTGKDLPLNAKQQKDGHYLIKGIKVWGYDLINPNQDFSVGHFIKFTKPLIKKIHHQNQLPILVGGTGLYLKAVTGSIDTINIPPNPSLRKKLEKLSRTKLANTLKKINPDKFNSLNNSDSLNPRRLIRAIEVAIHNQKSLKPKSLKLDSLWLGLTADKKILDANIKARVIKRIKFGSQKEVESLIKKGYSFNLPSMSAMGYKQWRLFFDKEIATKELEQTWNLAEKQYLRRQLTWFNKQKNINWFDISKPDYYQHIVNQVATWYTK